MLAHYGLGDARAEAVSDGLINQTFRIRDDCGRAIAVAQRLHPVFSAEVNLDIDAVTTHLHARCIETPRLLHTRDGAAFVALDGGVWRLLTYIEGVTVHRLASPAQATSAGEVLGRFHDALAGLAYEFRFRRSDVHDTAAHLRRLEQQIRPGDAWDQTAEYAAALGRDILRSARALPPLGSLPRRIVHGDPKISNILFYADRLARARCLIDLDTIGRQPMANELGDAMRSWCNPGGEDGDAPRFDLTLFEAALAGYFAAAPNLLDPPELAAIVQGVMRITVELAARFCGDVFADSYFGWDPSRYPSRREHNLARARNQLALFQSITAQSAPAQAIVATLASRRLPPG